MRFIQVSLDKSVPSFQFIVSVDECNFDTCVDHIRELSEQYDTDNGGVIDINDKVNYICDNIQQEIPCEIIHENCLNLFL
jgi:hypothetical protein